jgi:hypothetical protein
LRQHALDACRAEHVPVYNMQPLEVTWKHNLSIVELVERMVMAILRLAGATVISVIFLTKAIVPFREALASTNLD